VKEESQNYLDQLYRQADIDNAKNSTSLFEMLKDIEEHGVEVIWEKIKDAVSSRMLIEFGSIYGNNSIDPRFTELLANAYTLM